MTTTPALQPAGPVAAGTEPLTSRPAPKTMQEYREYLLSIMPPGQKPGPWLAFRGFEERRTRR